MIADAAERARARDPARSVIVQAPAGSGKTELLTQRYLALLAVVDEPEQILAVTFTRKAAAEMRQRVLRALRPAADDNRLPETAELAAAVLRQSERRNWQLAEHPARLRIRTFDSLSQWLASGAPVSDGRGAASGVVNERPQPLYEQAARCALELLDDDEFGPPLQTVLSHLDNRADRFVQLLAAMLERRDQWLPLFGTGALGAEARPALEAGLGALAQHALATLAGCLQPGQRAELLRVLPVAAEFLHASGVESPLTSWRGRVEFPEPEVAELAAWRALPQFFLTTAAAANFRKPGGLNKKAGFAKPNDGGDADINAAAKALLADVADDERLATALAAVRALPEPSYSDDQWRALEALTRVLPLVAAELELVFNRRGETDYIQIAQQALAALQDAAVPTGLALALDYQIRHILIDEFQDTSRTQLRLLQALTRGWTPDDGRSLMLVGDPLQSIYRFRQAEVSLFLELWEQGLDALPLEAITLSSNFRSDPVLVEWVNSTFDALLPARHDPATGAVRFAPGTPQRAATPDAGVSWHRFPEPGRVDEAEQVACLVEQVLAASATDTVGILVRTRNQARLIAPALRARNIAFSGSGLERPGESGVEQDLLALTRALSHLGDRTGWLALLRAPWCGLSLADLDRLAGDDWSSTVFELLADEARLAGLSPDGRLRAKRIHAVMAAGLARKGTLPLRDWVEGTWQALGGPALLQTERELALADQCLQQLERVDAGGDIAAAFDLHTRLRDREDSAMDGGVQVHLLTLFKAKGLEYDVVIVPALDGHTRGDTRRIVATHEYPSSGGETRYLLAPIEASGAPDDPLAAMIRSLQDEQLANERDRLLYVAVTRARRALHLCHQVQRDSRGEVAAPHKRSLLYRMWPLIAADCESLTGPAGTPEQRAAWYQPLIRRVAADWQPPVAPPRMAYPAVAPPAEPAGEVTYDWAGSDAMRVGRVVHRCLQYLAENAGAQPPAASLVAAMLAEEGVEVAGLDAATAQVGTALQNTLEDEHGRWALAGHAHAANEWPLTLSLGGKLQRLVIDRSFVDADGVRWIIDYKTSRHEGADLQGFLDQQVERYTLQLETYATALRLLEPGRTVRAALYFPLLSVLREVPLSAAAPAG